MLVLDLDFCAARGHAAMQAQLSHGDISRLTLYIVKPTGKWPKFNSKPSIPYPSSVLYYSDRCSPRQSSLPSPLTLPLPPDATLQAASCHCGRVSGQPYDPEFLQHRQATKAVTLDT